MNDTSKQINDLQKQINTLETSPAMKNNQLAREWEEWARRIYLNISENTSIVPTTANVKKAIEEAIGIGSKNSQDERKIESLITQKNILLKQKGISDIFKKNLTKKGQTSKIASIRPLILVLTSMNRIQKVTRKYLVSSQKQKLEPNQQFTENIQPLSPSQQYRNSPSQNQKPKQSFFSMNLNDEYELSDNCSPIPIFNNFADE